MTRTILFTAATLATLATAAIAPNTAAAKISSLGECYDAVVTYCNANHPNNASECAGGSGGGFDQCDEVFASTSGGMSFDSLQLKPQRGGLKLKAIRSGR